MDTYEQRIYGEGEHKLIVAKVNKKQASEVSNPYRYANDSTELMLSYDGKIITALPTEEETLIEKVEFASELGIDLSNITITYADVSYPVLVLEIRRDKLLPFELAEMIDLVPVVLDDLVENQAALNILDIQTLTTGVESARDTFMVESGVMIKFEGNIISYQSVIVSEDQDVGLIQE